MTSLSTLIEPGALQRLPIFPLPGAVLLPHTLLPLHIFEGRYVAMIQHCLEQNLPIGLIMIEPGHEDAHLGCPPVVPTFGIGRVIASSELDDGRFFIMLRGMARARLVEEVESDFAFRTVRAQLITEALGDPDAVKTKVQTLGACLSSLMLSQPSMAQAASHILEQGAHAAELADRLAHEVFSEPAQRQRLLEISSVDQRLDAIVEELLALIGAGARTGLVN
jgi:hypothetical protein